jgi:hypothetical protein
LESLSLSVLISRRGMRGLELVNLLAHGMQGGKRLKDLRSLHRVIFEFLDAFGGLPNADVDALTHVLRSGRKHVPDIERAVSSLFAHDTLL